MHGRWRRIPEFSGKASFGFHFSCEDKGGLNPPTGQLRLQLTYTDHGTSDFLDSPFSIQETADRLDPVLESMFCIGQNPPPDGRLIFVGRYRPTTPPPTGFPQTCPRRETSATEVTSDLDSETVFYTRAGSLAGGNLTVK